MPQTLLHQQVKDLGERIPLIGETVEITTKKRYGDKTTTREVLVFTEAYLLPGGALTRYNLGFKNIFQASKLNEKTITSIMEVDGLIVKFLNNPRRKFRVKKLDKDYSLVERQHYEHHLKLLFFGEEGQREFSFFTWCRDLPRRNKDKSYDWSMTIHV